MCKNDGDLRPCINYRTLNDHNAKLPYPFSLVPAALEELRGAHTFSKLDLRSAYNLVCIWEGDEWKTALITPSGQYENQVMLYSLSISPSFFQGFFYERGVRGVPPPVCHRVHRRYPDLIPEHGQTSLSRDAGPTPTQETPPLPEAREV